MSKSSQNKDKAAASTPAATQDDAPVQDVNKSTESDAPNETPPSDDPVVEAPVTETPEASDTVVADEPVAEGEEHVLVADLEKVVQEAKPRPVEVTGIRYESVGEAALALSIPVEAMEARLAADNEEYATYKYVE